MKRLLLTLLSLFYLFSCTTVQMRYDTTVKLRNDREIYYTYEAPIEVAGTAVACALTIWAYGGWCWSYFNVPFEDDRKNFIIEAHNRLEQKMQGRWFMIGDERLSREGFFSQRMVDTLYDDAGEDLELKPAPRPRHKKVSLRIEEEIKIYQAKRSNELDHPDYTTYIYGDGGSEFSYHGSGFGIGYKWTNFMLDIGLGIANRNHKLSNPFSISASFEMKPFFMGLGASYYQGADVQLVQFSDGNDYEAGIEWQYGLIHGSFGTYILKNALSNYQITAEVGAGLVIHDKYSLREIIDSVPADEEPEGVVTGSNSGVTRRVLKEGVGAPFIRVALIYWLRNNK